MLSDLQFKTWFLSKVRYSLREKSFRAYRILNDFKFYFSGFPALLHIYVTGIGWIGMWDASYQIVRPYTKQDKAEEDANLDGKHGISTRLLKNIDRIIVLLIVMWYVLLAHPVCLEIVSNIQLHPLQILKNSCANYAQEECIPINSDHQSAWIALLIKQLEG